MTPPLMTRYTQRKLVNAVFVGLTAVATIVALLALVAILWTLVRNGLGALDARIFTMDQPAVGTAGGLRNALVGSALLCLGAMVVAVAVGILAGTWLAEYGDGTRLAATVRFLNDVLLSAPSILVGLFAYEVMVRPFHGFSGTAGVLALALLATPVVTRTTEDILRLQASALREAGMALGASRGFVIRRVIWRASRTGLMTGALLGFARISGETAPLLFTSLGNPFLSARLSGPIAALPTTIFQFALSPYDDWRALAWAGALLIAMAVLAANVIGRVLSRRSQPQ